MKYKMNKELTYFLNNYSKDFLHNFMRNLFWDVLNLEVIGSSTQTDQGRNVNVWH